jgi:hypothetical protein
MTQRSILAGQTPTVIVRAGGDVRVQGWEGDRVLATTDSRWGLKVERRSESEIARLRAKVGEHVLFDVRVDPLSRTKKDAAEAIEVQIGGNGEVQVPQGSHVKVYAGKNADAHGLQGSLTLYAGRDVRIGSVQILNHASAGGAIDVECETVAGQEVKLEAGRDLRCHIRNLTHARVMVSDLGGEWEGVIGDGRLKIRLKAGGDVTVVTDQEVIAQPPHYVLGRLERTNAAADRAGEP